MIGDNQLDAALQSFHGDPATHRDLEAVVERVLATAIEQTPQQRGFLPRSPMWGSQSMFSATKFVVAGAIVALFGGFLLAGAMTQQDGETLPAAVTESPSPMTTEELLSGMVTEEVEPGVLWVLSDGAGHDLDGIDDVVVTPEGDVWVAQSRHARYEEFVSWGPINDNQVVRLGQPDAALRSRDVNRWELGLADDGAPVLMGLGNPLLWGSDDAGFGPLGNELLGVDLPDEPINDPSVFRDGRWTPFPQSESDSPCTGSSRPPVEHLVVGDECWFSRLGEQIERLGSDRPNNIVPATAFGASDDQTVSRLVAEADGTGWASVSEPGGWAEAEFAGLARYDGSTWSVIPYAATTASGNSDEDRPVIRGFLVLLSVAPDGTPWVGVSHAGYLTVAHWDGDRWGTHGPVQVGSMIGQTHFRPDGSVLFLDGLAVFDATELRSTGLDSGKLAFDQLGNGWKVSGDRLYVITPDVFAPEAVAATE